MKRKEIIIEDNSNYNSNFSEENINESIIDNSTYGVLNTTRDYGNYTVTRGGLAVNPYFDNDLHIHRDNSVIPNDKGEMVFPELLFKIIKKNLPGISSIPLVTTRVGMPSVRDSTVVTVRRLFFT